MTIKTIYVHCSDTPNGRPHTAADIHRWHQEKGWHGIGYHYFIQLDGTEEAGRPEYWEGAHVFGDNKGTLGIMLVGRDAFTNEQYRALYALLMRLRGRYPNAAIRGHCETDPGRTCPGFDVPAWLKSRGIDRK